MNFKKYLAEFIGTFVMVFAGTGAIVVNANSGVPGNTGIALVFGLSVAVMVYSLGPISGAHINPAVTIAFALGREFEKKEVLPYIISQLSGATLASLSVLKILGKASFLGATLPLNGNYMQSFYLETLLTFFLMFVIAGTSIGKAAYKQFAGLAIGGTVAFGALFGGPVSGASMNPARSFGPALISNNFNHHWIYWLAPVTGAVLAVFIFKTIDNPNES